MSSLRWNDKVRLKIGAVREMLKMVCLRGCIVLKGIEGRIDVQRLEELGFYEGCATATWDFEIDYCG